MLDKQQIEAAILQMLDEMGDKPTDSHELYLMLRHTLDSMGALGMPLPDDLIKLEQILSSVFESEMKLR